ncbi:MAG: exodeoxyribonuclease VII small subunit [Thermovirgaceae bacterium]|nr:exodeoxyribonuclease VII small subunit [Thermovirgaceae bacterium]
MSYSDDMTKLQDIVNRLDSGEMSLEESLALFEKGISLVNSCRKFLEKAQQKVSLISMDANDTEGKPWDPLRENTEKKGERS